MAVKGVVVISSLVCFREGSHIWWESHAGPPPSHLFVFCFSLLLVP